jgi:sugar-specific transcriptional regulator TrmB
MDFEKTLHRLGLTPNQSKVYTSLVESGPALVSTIAHRSGLHRPTVYLALPALIEQGLVSVFPKRKQKMYVAEPPEKLRRLFEQFSVQFQEMLPQLSRNYSKRSARPLIKFLEGKKAIAFVFEDIVRTLKRGEVFYRYSSRKATTNGDAYIPKSYRELRDRKQLQRFVITNELVSKGKRPRLERAVKVVPRKFDLFEYDVTQLIYADKIAFVDYSSQTAVIIENPSIATFQRKLFELLYNLL